MSYPAAYLRKSRSDDPAREVSREVQEQAVRALAARDGHEDVVLFVDWDRSGDEKKIQRRTAFAAMVKALENGEVSAIYAYSQDRLYRSVGTFSDLMAKAEAARVKIVTPGGVIGGDGSPMATAYSQLGAVFAELELNTAKARAKAAAEARRRRGDAMGALPYGYQRTRGEDGVVRLVPDPSEPVAPILDAWERSGRQPRKCARILNDELRIPAKRGGHWERLSVLRLIEREAPDRLPRRAASGRRGESASRTLLAKLLRCHCGRTLTPNISGGRQSYYCARGHDNTHDHPRSSISETRIIGWVKDEAARLRVGITAYTTAEADGSELAALDAKRARLVESYIEGLIDKPERDRRILELDRQRERLETRHRAQDVPPGVDWSWPPHVINGALRALWQYVQLDDQMQPVRAEWTVPEWRAEG